ncbi:MAG: FecR family protein, partial [Holophagales bacterium]|nr:FecR family protein [Holophagales bacterium]
MHESYEEKMSAADDLIERATSGIRNAEPSSEQRAEAAARVWAQLAGKHNARRGMKLLREGDAPPLDLDEDSSTNLVALDERRPRFGKMHLLAAAAMLIVAIGTVQWGLRTFWPNGPSATVTTVDGQLFKVAETSQLPVSPGSEILEHEVVRTGRDGGAVVRLADGSLVELAPRTELSIDEGRRGTTLRLTHGNVIVEAAEQRSRHLYVSTDDCLVSVTGTIFSVNHGTKGSKVSVIEGEVRVDHSGKETTLRPGDQVTTHHLLASTAVEKEISWSQNIDTYLEILRQFDALERDIALRVPHPALRYESRLLDLAPADTVIFAAAPNVADTVAQTHALLQERLAQSPELAQWWASEAGGSFQEQIDYAMEALSELGSYLGDEVAFAGYFEGDEVGGVVGLAEVEDAAGLRDFAERKLDELHAEIGEEAGEHDLVFVEDPDQVTGGEALYLWFHQDFLVVTIDAERLRQTADLILDGAANPFVGSSFYTEIRRLYDEGAEFLVAADLETLVAVADAVGDREGGDAGPALAFLGVDNARHLIVEQKKAGERTQHRLVTSFSDARHGIASWLAEPAPMGSLGFVSPDAKLLASVVFEDPAKLLDDIFA